MSESGSAVPAERAEPMQSPKRSRPRLARVFPWAVLSLGILIFYWIEAAARKGPWVFSDELEWSQLSRSIATTGHAARRTVPHSFESLYSYLIAPAWWIHSTATAYGAIKDINSVVMCLTAVPAYLLARRLVSQRSAVAVALLAIAIPAMVYATSIVPEPLAYLWFVTAAYAAICALAAPNRKNVTAAIVLAAAGPLIRSQYIVLPVMLVAAAAILWIARGGALRRQWRKLALASVSFIAFALLFNSLVVMRVQSWNFGQYFNHHTIPHGALAAGALTIGLGMGPVIGGLASLWLPERTSDPAYRAFAVYLALAVMACLVYTAAKVTYVMASLPDVGTLLEERNLFMLSPLLLLGTAMVFESRKINWYVIGAATVAALAVVWSSQLEVGAPQYEAPGLAMPTLLNKTFIFTVQDIHLVLIAASAIAIGLLLVRTRRWAAPVAVVLAGAWLLTGEIYETTANDRFARTIATDVLPPAAWIDSLTQRAPTTFLGTHLDDQNPVLLTEFWNRSIDHVYALDNSAPPPGPRVAPFLLSTDGTLSDYTGDKYTVGVTGFVLDAKVIATHSAGGEVYTLYSTPTPWRLRSEVQDVTHDGWGENPFEYFFFPRGGPGVVTVRLSRTGYNGPGPPGRVTIQIGKVVRDANNDAGIGAVIATQHATVLNGHETTVLVHVASTPVALSVTVTPTISPPPDTRLLAAQPSFSFKRDR